MISQIKEYMLHSWNQNLKDEFNRSQKLNSLRMVLFLHVEDLEYLVLSFLHPIIAVFCIICLKSPISKMVDRGDFTNMQLKGPYADHILIPQGSTGSSNFFDIKWKPIFF